MWTNSLEKTRKRGWLPRQPAYPLTHHNAGHADAVSCLAVSPDGKLALSGAAGGVDHTIRVWDLAGSAGLLKKLEGHTADVRQPGILRGRAVSPTREAPDRTVRTWDVKTGAEISKVDAPTRGAIAVSPINQFILTFGWGNDSRLHRADLKNGNDLGTLDDHGLPLAVQGDGRLFASGFDTENRLSVYETETGKLLRRFGAQA